MPHVRCQARGHEGFCLSHASSFDFKNTACTPIKNLSHLIDARFLFSEGAEKAEERQKTKAKQV